MKKSRLTDSQIMAAHKRVEVSLPVPKIYRELGIEHVHAAKFAASEVVTSL